MIDIASRFKSAYGIIPVHAQRPQIPGGQYLPIVSGVDVYQNTEDLSFEDMDIKGGDYELKFAGGKLTKSGTLGNVFAPPIMCLFRKAKRLIETPLDGDGGVIVERYGDCLLYTSRCV